MRMTRALWRLIARQAQDMAKQGRIIDAIKHIRQATNCGLKEAFEAAYKLRGLPDIQGADYKE